MPIALEQLSHSYDTVDALRDVSAHATPGAITAIVGPNAAGKSTLVRCIIGALRPTRGAVMLDRTPTHDLSPSTIATRIAYVSQRPTVSADFTVREVIELGRYVLPADPNRVDRALDAMELRELAHRPFATLSAGQQQRVTMARALAQLDEHNGHLILDEPTSAMDLLHVQRTMALLRRCADHGATVLVILHDLTTAAAVADDAWLLDDGQLIAGGPVDDVLTPTRLKAIFKVGFHWIDDPHAGRLLIAEHLHCTASESTTIRRS